MVPSRKSVAAGTRRDHVDADATVAQLLRPVAGEHLDRALHRRVDRPPVAGGAREHAGDVHDRAAVGDAGSELLGEEVDAGEVDVHKGLHIPLADVRDAFAAGPECVKGRFSNVCCSTGFYAVHGQSIRDSILL
jgi:hypothetical protein